MGCNPQANWTAGSEEVPAVNLRLEELTNARKRAHQALQQKTQINKPVRTLETGQEVWLDARNIKTKAPSKKMEQKRLGPFTITKKISPVAYQLRFVEVQLRSGGSNREESSVGDETSCSLPRVYLYNLWSTCVHKSIRGEWGVHYIAFTVLPDTETVL